MNVILGASGQVGSHIVNELNKLKQPVTAIVRNSEKIKDKTITTKVADLFKLDEVIKAFKGATTVFLLTPENPDSEDLLGDTKIIVNNYQKAIEKTGIKKVVALSCVGAHVQSDTGNILMSKTLEKMLETLEVEKIIVRPSYYFSNWLVFAKPAIEEGTLTTFLPANFKCEMQSPVDVAKFIAEKISNPISEKESTHIFELAGQEKYSANDVAKILSEIANKKIVAQEIKQSEWENSLQSFGFTENAAKNLSKMTKVLVDGIAIPEKPKETIKLNTSLDTYLKQNLE